MAFGVFSRPASRGLFGWQVQDAQSRSRRLEPSLVERETIRKLKIGSGGRDDKEAQVALVRPTTANEETMMSDPMLVLLAQRLDRQEQENRRWRRALIAITVTACAVALMGQAAPRPTVKTDEAERFILMGRSGKPRAILTEASDGNVGLRFVDAGGQVRMALSVEGNGQPNLALSDSKGGRRIGMTVSTDGSVTLGILDAAEKDRAGLGLSSDGTMGFFLSDRENTRRMILGVGPEGFPSIGLYGKSNGARVIAVAKDDAPPQLALFDKAGKVIWKAP
jgi:hypothetical protein